MKTAVISFNRQGNEIAERVKKIIGADLFIKSSSESFNIVELTGKLIESYEGIIFISSTGIAVRAIAPYLKSKDRDPAVVVIDCLGRYVISLLSGHLGGANELTLNLAKFLGAETVITTATDMLGVTAPDMIAKKNGLVIESLEAAKEIAALLVDGKKVAFIDEENKIEIPSGYCRDTAGVQGVVYVTNSNRYMNNLDLDGLKVLKLIRKNVVLGIGCKRDYPVKKMKENILEQLIEYKIDHRAIKQIATIEVKKDEKAILELVQHFTAEFKVFSKEEVKKIDHKYEGSDFVEKTIGVRAVCEPAVELSGGRLLTGKINCDGMTLCIGRLE